MGGGRAESYTSTEVPDVVGALEHQNIAICPVPEAKTAKNRVHLDVYARAVEDVVALGARVDRPAEETGFGWTTMLDPEGNELCVFVRPDLSALPAWRVHGMGIDSVDSAAIARWWAEALDAELVDHTAHGDGWWTVEHATPDDTFTWDFAPVPEPKTVKNRLHWDLYGTKQEFVDRGARLLWEMPRWTVLADPEGNEFCVFPEP
ncbi:hypothetical protein GCM10011519_28670 [Marmoricola endophyticus]|uniref:Glyoxalase-like domain-containing protein n=1 Tax=Marmoricola endophyticus TaxID=2040280 RepID=A0A917F610_9ACTN|nr:hypothetical protein GCM10011519_28670 [Marmoricola endophyticus]